jgi:hypothetical protein
MRKFYATILAMVFMLTAANVAVLDNSKVTGYTISGETSDYLDMNFNMKDISYEDVSTEKGAFTQIGIESGTLSKEAGYPALPAYNKMIAMPYGAEPQVEVISYDVKSYKLAELGITNPIMPAQPSYSKSAKPEDIKFIYNESAYIASKYNESPIASVSKSGTMRGIGVGVVSVEPIRYKPSTGEITVYNNVKVRVNYISADPRAAEIAREEYSPFFESAYAKLINYKPLDTKADLMTYPVTYLILANSNLNGNADLNEFIAWKTSKGFKVVANYVAASSTISTNDTWIESQYNTLSPKPSFVLVIGDHDGTYGVLSEVNPPLGSTGSVTRSDLLYGVMGATSSTNKIPSMYVGRFSVRALADLTAQVDKTLWYEKEQFLVGTPDLNYLTYTLGVAGVDATYAKKFGDPQIYYGWTYYFNSANGMANSKTYYSATSNLSTADLEIRNFMSAGAAFYNYTAHGDITMFYDPNFTNTHVDAMTNTNKYAIMVGNCCLTGSFGTTECFGEALLNAPSKGAVGYIGASMSTYWNEDLTMGVGMDVNGQTAPALDTAHPGMYDGIMALGYSSTAAMKHVGLMAVDNNNQTYEDDYWSSYHLFGDPSLMPYFGIPGTMTATHSGTINAGATTYSVSGTTPYAYIALSDQNGVLHGAARASSSGAATITVTAYSAGDTGKMVITAQFKRPYYADITVGGGSTPPATPTLLSPATGSSTSDLTPTFDWNDVSGATSYTIQIDNNSTFASPEYTNSPTVSTYTPGANLATGTWYWRVLATNTYGSSSYTTGWSVILGSAPVVPTLATPTNASTTTDQTPAFDWNDVSGATSYTILVDNDVAFGSPEITNSPATSTYTPAANLAYGTYYWKVLATNAFGSSAYTASWSLIIQAPLPGVPTLASPTNASGTTDTTPAFDWSDASDATGYEILVDNNSNFGSPEITATPTVSNYTAVSALAAGTYYWKVKSTNGTGSSAYTASWTLTVQAPNVALSTALVSTTAAPEGTDTDSFNINNIGDASLDYTITKTYVWKSGKADITVHSNDFATFPGTGYTNSNWAANAGAARVIGATTAVTGVLTSPVFDGTACSSLYLDFTQNFSYRNGSWTRVEIYNGSAWTEIYYDAVGSTVSQHILLPEVTANMQIKFTGYMTRQGQNAYWEIDNVVVSGPEAGPSYTWLTINSALTGSVTPAGSSTINITCDAAGLAEGTYTANITVASNDPDEPSKVLPVEFIVYLPLTSPENTAVVTATSTEANLGWDAVPGATIYYIYRSTTDPYSGFTQIASSPNNSYQDTDVVTGNKYFYYITAGK